jgi:biopolymer transport protein TolR
MWGFVSVMLALLFMFVPSTTDAYRSVPVDRAPARHSRPQPGAQKEDALLISITRDGNVFFRDHRIQRSELADEIREKLRNGAEKKAYLAVDTRAKYGDVITVLDQIRFAGIENVNFLTEEPFR